VVDYSRSPIEQVGGGSLKKGAAGQKRKKVKGKKIGVANNFFQKRKEGSEGNPRRAHLKGGFKEGSAWGDLINIKEDPVVKERTKADSVNFRKVLRGRRRMGPSLERLINKYRGKSA